MKTTKTFAQFLLAILATASALHAYPFSTRQVPGGFAAPSYWSDHSDHDVCADYAGTGQNQWYFGGETIRAFPASFSRTLPSIKLAQNSAATPHPLGHALLDVDRDGDLDIVRVVDWNYNRIHSLVVYLNQGSSHTIGFRRDWTENPNYDEGEHFTQIAAGDFNRDGAPDIVMLTTYLRYIPDLAYPARGYPSIWWNDGLGNFSSVTNIDGRGYSRASNMVIADIDRDSDSDILICDWNYRDTNENWHQYLITYRNDGAGKFVRSASERPRFNLRKADLNRDSWPDLLSWVDFELRVALNAKDGTFPTDVSSNVTGAGLLCTGDLDEDGIEDLVYSPKFSKQLRFRKGMGNGTFSTVTQSLGDFPAEVIAVTTADAEPDGDIDLMVQTEGGAFHLVENLAPRRTPVGSIYAEVALSGVTQLEAGDFNRDGIDDVLAIAPEQKKIWLLYGNETASGSPFSAPIFKLTQAEAPSGVVVDDFNRDGRPDFAYTLPGKGEVRLVQNNGNPIVTLWPDSSIQTFPGASLIASGEFGTRNGQRDILVSSVTNGRVSWLYPSGNAWTSRSVLNSSSPAPGALAPANTTGSPGDETFLSSSDASGVRIRGWQLNPSFVNAGDFTAPLASGQQSSPAMAWADLELGGNPELVFVNGNGKLCYWKPAIGGNTCSEIGAPEGTVRDIEAVDWNRDGRMDLLCATSTGLTLFYKPDSVWQSRRLSSLATGFDSVVTLNFNNGRLPDAAVSCTADGKVYFVRNRSWMMEFTPRTDTLALAPGSVANALVADVTHAGRFPSVFRDLPAETPVAVHDVNLRFTKATQVNGQWKKGDGLTPSEFSQVISGVSMLSNGKVVGASGPGEMSTFGNFPIQYHPVLGNLVPIASGTTAELDFRVTLTTTAGQAPGSVQAFFVELTNLQGQLLDDRDILNPAALVGSNGATLVTIKPSLSPLQEWRMTNFGTTQNSGNAANDSDPDADNQSNLIEYITGQNPKSRASVGAGNAIPLIVKSQGPNATVLAEVRLLTILDGKVQVALEESTDLKSWKTLSTRTAGTWTGLQPGTSSLPGGYSRFVFDTGKKPAISGQSSLRIAARELP
ncbi:MAG: VCBS repeat-containing protein [Verrucomicrobiales bacterium]